MKRQESCIRFSFSVMKLDPGVNELSGRHCDSAQQRASKLRELVVN